MGVNDHKQTVRVFDLFEELFILTGAAQSIPSTIIKLKKATVDQRSIIIL